MITGMKNICLCGNGFECPILVVFTAQYEALHNNKMSVPCVLAMPSWPDPLWGGP
jgi:hypothetical protein